VYPVPQSAAALSVTVAPTTLGLAGFALKLLMVQLGSARAGDDTIAVADNVPASISAQNLSRRPTLPLPCRI
jgi:hypothetical protein